MWVNVDVAHTRGAAWRRRQRWLRAQWRHGQLTLQMLLATYEHHDAPRGQSKAKSGEEVRGARHGHDPEQPPPQLYKEEPGGSPPPSLAEPRGPQERVQLRTVEHIADVVPMVQILDIPVPQMENQLVEVCRQLDILIPEQAIEVTKISSSSRRCRPRVPMVQLMVEQLVEVPTIVSFSSLQQQTAEQIIDTPVPRRGGGGWRGLQGSSEGQNSATFLGGEHVDIPLPLRREGGGSLQGLRPGQSSTAFDSWRRWTASRFPSEFFWCFSCPLIFVWRAESSGFFALFPERKKCEVWPAGGLGGGGGTSSHPRRRLSPGYFGSSSGYS